MGEFRQFLYGVDGFSLACLCLRKRNSFRRGKCQGGGRPFAIEFFELAHEEECTMFVKARGVGLFGIVIALVNDQNLGSEWNVVVGVICEAGKKFGEHLDVSESQKWHN